MFEELHSIITALRADAAKLHSGTVPCSTPRNMLHDHANALEAFLSHHSEEIRPKSLAHITKMSDLLRLALNDLKRQEELVQKFPDQNEVCMSYWWKPRDNMHGVCAVCLAGSVMKFSLARPTNVVGREISPEHYDRPTMVRLLTLNYLREGNIYGAYKRFYPFDDSQLEYPEYQREAEKHSGEIEVIGYDEDAGQWWHDMEKKVMPYLLENNL